jgi:cellulose synthase/poly-beta-1,6-N-acetylglucosamine synthase-like glycosyltransferase
MLRCLDALLTLDYPDYEVLVLDNESSDGTAAACRERGAGSEVPVRVEVVAGSVGHLRNRAGELADGELIAFTDSDCIPQVAWLREAVRPFADPGIGVVQGKTLPDPAEERSGWDATIEVTAYSGRFESCNLVVRRDAFVESDGFDERVGHFWEDTAAGWALLRRGWRAAFAPGAVVYHDVTRPPFAWWLDRAERYGNVCSVVARYPELRRELLWGRYFVRGRDAALVLALAGGAAALQNRRALALAIPYAWIRRPQPLTPRGVAAMAKPLAFDLAALASLARSSIRYKALVL